MNSINYTGYFSYFQRLLRSNYLMRIIFIYVNCNTSLRVIHFVLKGVQNSPSFLNLAKPPHSEKLKEVECVNSFFNHLKFGISPISWEFFIARNESSMPFNKTQSFYGRKANAAVVSILVDSAKTSTQPG